MTDLKQITNVYFDGSLKANPLGRDQIPSQQQECFRQNNSVGTALNVFSNYATFLLAQQLVEPRYRERLVSNPIQEIPVKDMSMLSVYYPAETNRYHLSPYFFNFLQNVQYALDKSLERGSQEIEKYSRALRLKSWLNEKFLFGEITNYAWRYPCTGKYVGMKLSEYPTKCELSSDEFKGWEQLDYNGHPLNEKHNPPTQDYTIFHTMNFPSMIDRNWWIIAWNSLIKNIITPELQLEKTWSSEQDVTKYGTDSWTWVSPACYSYYFDNLGELDTNGWLSGDGCINKLDSILTNEPFDCKSITTYALGAFLTNYDYYKDNREYYYNCPLFVPMDEIRAFLSTAQHEVSPLTAQYDEMSVLNGGELVEDFYGQNVGGEYWYRLLSATDAEHWSELINWETLHNPETSSFLIHSPLRKVERDTDTGEIFPCEINKIYTDYDLDPEDKYQNIGDTENSKYIPPKRLSQDDVHAFAILADEVLSHPNLDSPKQGYAYSELRINKRHFDYEYMGEVYGGGEIFKNEDGQWMISAVQGYNHTDDTQLSNIWSLNESIPRNSIRYEAHQSVGSVVDIPEISYTEDTVYFGDLSGMLYITNAPDGSGEKAIVIDTTATKPSGVTQQEWNNYYSLMMNFFGVYGDSGIPDASKVLSCMTKEKVQERKGTTFGTIYQKFYTATVPEMPYWTLSNYSPTYSKEQEAYYDCEVPRYRYPAVDNVECQYLYPIKREGHIWNDSVLKDYDQSRINVKNYLQENTHSQIGKCFEQFRKNLITDIDDDFNSVLPIGSSKSLQEYTGIPPVEGTWEQYERYAECKITCDADLTINNMWRSSSDSFWVGIKYNSGIVQWQGRKNSLIINFGNPTWWSFNTKSFVTQGQTVIKNKRKRHWGYVDYEGQFANWNRLPPWRAEPSLKGYMNYDIGDTVLAKVDYDRMKQHMMPNLNS